MTQSIVVLTAAFVLLLATSGSAQDAYDRDGFYVGLAGTYAIERFEDDTEKAFRAVFGPPVSASIDNSLGAIANIGYRFDRHYSVEVEAEWLHGFVGDISVPGSGSGTVAEITTEPEVITCNGKGYLLTGRYQPFFLLGLGVMTAKREVRDTLGLGFSESSRFIDVTMRFGGGLDFYATENIVLGLRLDYVLPFVDLDGLNYISFGWGFQYRF